MGIKILMDAMDMKKFCCAAVISVDVILKHWKVLNFHNNKRAPLAVTNDLFQLSFFNSMISAKSHCHHLEATLRKQEIPQPFVRVYKFHMDWVFFIKFYLF